MNDQFLFEACNICKLKPDSFADRLTISKFAFMHKSVNKVFQLE